MVKDYENRLSSTKLLECLEVGQLEIKNKKIILEKKFFFI